MQIPCFFKPAPLEAAYVTAIFESEILHVSATVEFLIDTGATRTTLSDKDAIRLGIDYEMLEKLPEGMLGIGGSVDTYILKNAKLIFHKQDKTVHEETLDCICILKHSILTERILRIPSILGRDILNKYALIYNRKREAALITDEMKLLVSY
jgi:hypothetical protein